MRQSLEFTSRANGSLTSFGFAITTLIVFIAGLVVMITMLSAVKERQKEIGVFRAVGFGQRDIAKMVFYETAVLSGAAAIVGVTVGLVGGLGLPLITSTLSLRFAFDPSGRGRGRRRSPSAWASWRRCIPRVARRTSTRRPR